MALFRNRESLGYPTGLTLLAALSLASSCTRLTSADHSVLAPGTAASSTVSSGADLPDLRPHEQLPSQVREMLEASMERHGDQLTDLMISVVMLQYDAVETLATRLAAEPKLGRPVPGEKGTLNALLPGAFFMHQDALEESSRSLARAAKDRDEVQLVSSFGRVTGTCVGCHTAYLDADFDPLNHVDPGEPLPCAPGEQDCYDTGSQSDELGALISARRKL